ncbi:MAG: phage antirepressor KilAC domain-containing protein [Fusobacteriaceae bacterium]|jgi:phage antirepressor YoqD-like protein|nr:phage antirepressor KilAC domain-containing protein [Fusobacteriaceae bacterium]
MKAKPENVSATLYNIVCSTNRELPVKKVAELYGLSGIALNKLLVEWGIQYKRERYYLAVPYHGMGYTKVVCTTYTVDTDTGSFRRDTSYLKWTLKGRKFLFEELEKRGYHRLPVRPDVETRTRDHYRRREYYD